MTRFSSAWTGTLGAVVLLIASLIAVPAQGGSPSKLFPAFAGQKDSLGPVSIIADVLEIHDVKGNEKKVFLPDCMRLGEGFLKAFVEGMTAKGYQVQGKTFLSVGAQARTNVSYRIYSSAFEDRSDASASRLGEPPFYADSTLSQNPETLALWSKVLGATSVYEKKKGKPGKPILEAVQLRGSLGANRLFVVHVFHRQVSASNRVGMAILGIQKESLYYYSVTMIDCLSGEVLWADQVFFQTPIGDGMKEGDVKGNTDKFLKAMP